MVAEVEGSSSKSIASNLPTSLIPDEMIQTLDKRRGRRIFPAGAGRVAAAYAAVSSFVVLPYAPLSPSPRGKAGRVALLCVTAMAAAFVVFFTLYTSAQFDAYLTNAEDMGIMDQALWNTTHGAILHQTICNPIGDSNCLGDVSRFAIHFEPIMLPLALLYFVAASPKLLLFIQMLVVAAGAYPAYWIACRRLRSPLAGVCFAAVYLTYPAIQSAVLFDFHAVTLAPAFLLFAIYFMLTRNNVGLFIAAVLAMSTKEEIPLDIIMLGLAIFFFQGRRRVGVGLIALACAWLGVALVFMHMASPLGHSPTAGRYAYLGASPVQAALYVLTHPVAILRDQILGQGGARYLQTLLTPNAYLAVLSPMTWLLAVPSLMINLLSSDPSMHMGIHQYSADIVPVMIFSAISSVALLLALGRRLAPVIRTRWQRMAPPRPFADSLQQAPHKLPARLEKALPTIQPARVLLVFLLALIVVFSFRQQMRQGNLPISPGFRWPVVTSHAMLANELIPLIPATASVSAQDQLVPHLSHRRYIYQYPYMAYQSDYVFLDTADGIYPFTTQLQYNTSVQSLLQSGQFRIVTRVDGYILLAHIPAPPNT